MIGKYMAANLYKVQKKKFIKLTYFIGIGAIECINESCTSNPSEMTILLKNEVQKECKERKVG